MDEVPTGTVSDVLDWVGNDPARAEAALNAEYAGPNRSTLITRLEAIASEEDSAVSAGANETLPPESDLEDQAPGPEQPAEVTIDPSAEGTVIGPIHVRDSDVEVPQDADLTPLPGQDETAEPEAVDGEQVEFFQAVSATNGVILSINGQPFAFNAQMTATLKGAVDKMVAGLSL